MARITIAEKVHSIEPIRTIEDLHRHLQLAIEIEHATLPPYLAALYTLKGIPGPNEATYDVILGIVMEEMLHLALACNLLNAVDGQPRLAFADFIPEYPTKLPQADADFDVHIEACSDDALATFQQIELPDYPLPVAGRLQVGYRTIGEFYKHVKLGFLLLDIELGSPALFTGDPAKQLTDGYLDGPLSTGGGRGKLVRVTDLTTAFTAIDLIVNQGEGAHPPAPSTPAADRPHYFNFTDIRRRTIHGPDGGILPQSKQFDSSAVCPMVKDPRLAGPGAGEQSAAFNKAYSDLLRTLEAASNGAPDQIYAAWGDMYNVRSEFVNLVTTYIPASQFSFGPTFEFVSRE